MAKSWKDFKKDSKEKYNLYLCSVEWGRLRAAVHERAGGMCERCGMFKIDAVHHLTYSRKYAENLDDLQAICNRCHVAVHGRGGTSPVDPASANWFVGFLVSELFDRANSESATANKRWEVMATVVDTLLCDLGRAGLLDCLSSECAAKIATEDGFAGLPRFTATAE